MSLNGHKPLYQPWNEDEFMSSPSVQSMGWLERFMYRSLLQKAFFCADRPYLPNDDNQLWRLAGCENKEQWLRSKRGILQNFTKITAEGRKLLSHSRLIIDWEREQNRRQTLADKGRKGGLITQARAQAQLKPALSTELNRTEQTELNRTEQTSEEDMKLRDDITDKSRSILGIRISPISPDWKEIDSLNRVYKGRVVEAFEEWAKTRRGEMINYPLTEFVKVADGILAGIIEIGEDAEFDKFLAELYNIGNQAFAGKYKFSAKELYKKYGPKEVLSAYAEFFDNLNEYQASYSVRDFCEGGADSIIGARQLRKESSEEITRQLAAIEKLERAKVEKELASLPPDIDFSKFEL